MISPLSRVLFGVLALSICFLSNCGPTVGGASGESFSTSVKIDFAPRFDIDQAIVTVFRSEGYKLTAAGGGRYTFEQTGDLNTQQESGDWFAPGVVVLANVVLTEVEFATHLVQCEAFVHQNGSWIPARQGQGHFRTLMKRIKKLAGVL